MQGKATYIYKCRWCGKLEVSLPMEYENTDDLKEKAPKELGHNCEPGKIGICDLVGFELLDYVKE